MLGQPVVTPKLPREVEMRVKQFCAPVISTSAPLIGAAADEFGRSSR